MSVDINKADNEFYNPGFYPHPEENLFSPAVLHLRNSETDPVLKYEIKFAMIRYELKSIDSNAMLEQAICDYENVIAACDKYILCKQIIIYIMINKVSLKSSKFITEDLMIQILIYLRYNHYRIISFSYIFIQKRAN